MAAEKLSARQKMIGMMYLVLTALLALQVSSGVLEKFVLINKILEQGINSKARENAKKVEKIQAAVREMGNRRNDMKVLDVALDIEKETKQVISYVDGLKNKLIASSGGKIPKTGYPKGLKNETVVARLMINNGEGAELQKVLNGYMGYLSQATGKSYAPIALDAKDNEFFMNDPNQVSKDFTTLSFERTPLGAALATLSQLASEVVYAETQALEELAGSVGVEDVKFDNLTPLVRPHSNTVVAGTRYKADLFLTASSSGLKPEMYVDGKPIPVEDGVGKIDLLTLPGTYNQDGVSKKTFKAAIKLSLPDGRESTFVEDVAYDVVKPVIQVQSAAIQALYLNCGNELNIQVPALGKEYNPKFTVTGADVLQGDGKGIINVVPRSAEVKLDIYNNESLLGTQIFEVRRIPKPDISITSNGKAVDEKQGMAVPGPRKLEVRVLADESFKNFLPKDARYRVAHWEISLARGSEAVKTKKISTQDVNLSDFVALARAGDRLVIEIKKVERLNFREEIETVKLGTIVRTIPLN